MKLESPLLRVIASSQALGVLRACHERKISIAQILRSQYAYQKQRSEVSNKHHATSMLIDVRARTAFSSKMIAGDKRLRVYLGTPS